jgi:hypothetical protein
MLTPQPPSPGRQEEKPWRNEERWQHLRDNVHTKAKTEQSPDKRDFVDTWYWLMRKASKHADAFKVWYYASTGLTTLLAATVPVLVAFTGSVNTSTANILRIVAAALGVLVAGATAVLGVVEVGNRWRLYRTYAQALEEAAWDYLTSDRGDDNHKYNKFVADVNQARRAFGRGYLNQVAILQKAPTGSEDHAASGSATQLSKSNFLSNRSRARCVPDRKGKAGAAGRWRTT